MRRAGMHASPSNTGLQRSLHRLRSMKVVMRWYVASPLPNFDNHPPDARVDAPHAPDDRAVPALSAALPRVLRSATSSSSCGLVVADVACDGPVLHASLYCSSSPSLLPLDHTSVDCQGF